jgi:hypothetical protein
LEQSTISPIELCSAGSFGGELVSLYTYFRSWPRFRICLLIL